jgi:hypothetical protein
MKSKTALFRDLAEIDPARFADAPSKALKHQHISDETFGRDSHIYVGTAHGDRRRVERALERRGHLIHEDYWPGSDVVNVQVSYFKGWHWDE